MIDELFVHVIMKRSVSKITGRTFVKEELFGVYDTLHHATVLCNSMNKQRNVGDVSYRVKSEIVRGVEV